MNFSGFPSRDFFVPSKVFSVLVLFSLSQLVEKREKPQLIGAKRESEHFSEAQKKTLSAPSPGTPGSKMGICPDPGTLPARMDPVGALTSGCFGRGRTISEVDSLPSVLRAPRRFSVFLLLFSSLLSLFCSSKCVTRKNGKKAPKIVLEISVSEDLCLINKYFSGRDLNNR